MIDDVADKRVYCRFIAENGFHLPELFFAPFYDLRISIIGHIVVFLINELESCLIKFQLDSSAFIENRPGCTVFNGLRHIVDIDVIAEYLTGVPVLLVNRCACEADVGGIWQSVTDDTCYADFYLAGLSVDILTETVLAAVRLIGHNHDITAL